MSNGGQIVVIGLSFAEIQMLAITIFIAMQIGDIYTTLKILSQGGRELNLVMAKMFAMFGAMPSLIVVKAAVVGLFYYLIDEPYMTEILLALCVLYAVVVFHNFRQIKPE